MEFRDKGKEKEKEKHFTRYRKDTSERSQGNKNGVLNSPVTTDT